MSNPEPTCIAVRSLSPSLVLLSCLLVPSCGAPSPLLGARGSFDGKVVIRAESSGSQRELRGRLSFDHARGTFRWQTGSGQEEVELVHDSASGLRKRIAGKEAEVSVQDAADFALLTTLTSAELPEGASLETRVSGYTVVMGGSKLSIDWTAADGG